MSKPIGSFGPAPRRPAATPAVWRQVLGHLLLALALVAGIAAALAGSLITAAWISSPLLFLMAGLALGACASLLVGLGAAWVLAHRRRLATALGAGAVSVAIVMLLMVLFLLQPLNESVDPASRSLPPGATYWDLPTGSRIAVLKVEARGGVSAPPVVFLHGGPGAYSVAFPPVVNALSALADDGHDVYFYDQIGGGLSARLDDVSQYSIERHLADLHALHARIGSVQMILIGSSFGASLGASYMARHPQHVAAAVFSGAGPIFHPAWADIGDGKLEQALTPPRRRELSQTIQQPRLLTAMVLAQLNPNAAARFAPERELGPLFDRIANEFYLPATVCPGSELPVRSDGYGFWSNRMTSNSLWRRTDDPRPRLAEVATPVLVVRGACDYKKAEVAREYAEVFPNARFQAMQDAGHMPYAERPQAFLGHVRAFLAQVGAGR